MDAFDWFGCRGIFSLGKVFQSIDKDQSGSLELPEMRRAFQLMQLNVGPQAEEALFAWLDHDGYNAQLSVCML